MFIDQSYFIGPLTIAQLGQKAVDDKLKDFISRYEPMIMEAALGYDFYKAFLTGIDVGSDEQPEQRWMDLLNGIAFTDIYSVRKRFVGFGNTETKISPLAGFIYYEYMKDLASQNTGIGLVKTQGENSVSANVVSKPVNIFNDSAYQLRAFWELMQADQQKTTKVYPEFSPDNSIGYRYGVYNHNWFYWNNYQGNESYSFRTKNTFGI